MERLEHFCHSTSATVPSTRNWWALRTFYKRTVREDRLDFLGNLSKYCSPLVLTTAEKITDRARCIARLLGLKTIWVISLQRWEGLLVVNVKLYCNHEKNAMLQLSADSCNFHSVWTVMSELPSVALVERVARRSQNLRTIYRCDVQTYSGNAVELRVSTVVIN